MRHLLALCPVVAAATLCAADVSAQTDVRIVPRAQATVTLGGRIQTQLQSSSVSGEPTEVFFRRARLRLDIEVGDFVDARLNPDFAGGTATLQDAWVRLTFDDGLRLTFGQFKRAFSVFELSSSTDLPVIERDGRIAGLSSCPGVGGVCSFSRLTEKLSFDGRDQGLRVDGRIGDVSYAVTATNGEGVNAGDVNDAKSFSGRLSWETGGVTVGAFGGVHDHPVPLDGGGEDTDFAPAAGVDVEIGTWRDGLHVLAAAAVGDNWKAGADRRFTTLQALGSYYVAVGGGRVSGVEPLFRVGWADPDDEVDDDGALLFTPGVMLYLGGRNGVSLNLDAYAPRGVADTEVSFKLQSYLYF